LLQEAKEKSKQQQSSSSTVVKNPFVEIRQRVIQFLHGTFDRHLGGSATSCMPAKQVPSESKDKLRSVFTTRVSPWG
jgi:hypothetical protein